MSASNEPAKLANIVVPMFAAEVASRFHLANGASANLVLGVAEQDDCAAYAMTGEQTIVFGSDYVRGPKFALYELGLLSNYDIGWYLAGANLSDIAAMGAVPVGLLSIIRYPKDLDDADFADIVRGIRDCCASVGAANVGGDVGTAERIILSASAFGVTEPDALLRRSGARLGQAVVVTGPTGLAGAVMKYCTRAGGEEVLTDAERDQLLIKWRRVAPRARHGRLFAASRGVSACIDTSDGLAGALQSLCSASGVGITVDAADIPVVSAVSRVAAALAVDPFEVVFGDSVDFELVATVDMDCLDELRQAARDQDLPLDTIGVVTEGTRPVLQRGDHLVPLPGAPWIHSS